MGLTLLVFVFMLDGSESDIIRRAIFDCHRMDVAFCCTSRVRSLCAEQCKDVQCGTQITNSNFNMGSVTSPPRAHDGLVQLSRPFLQPPPLSFISSMQTQEPPSTHRPFTVTSLTQSPFAGFPTLIPFEPNIDSMPNTEMSQPQFTTISPIHSTIVKTLHHRVRTTPDPRIIRPPDSLVIIGEYDEDTATDSWGQLMSPSTDTTNAFIFPQRNFNIAGGGVVVPNSFISREVTDEKQMNRGDSSGWTTTRFCALMMMSRRCRRTRMRSFTSRNVNVDRRRTFVSTNVFLPAPHHQRQIRQRLSRPPQSWRVKILPAQKVITWPEGVETLPKFVVDGTASTRAGSDRKDTAFIRRFSMRPSKFSGQTGFTDAPDIEFAAHSRTTLAPYQMLLRHLRPYSSAMKPDISSITPSPSPHRFSLEPSMTFVKQPISTPPSHPQPQTSSAIPATTSEPCGVAPNFKPCLSSEQASHGKIRIFGKAVEDRFDYLLISEYFLGEGRVLYEKGQEGVRSAMDRGQCGLFSVAPFLECASQGHDNTECCRHKGIVTKTGPQCEQFCRPSHGLGILGLQHIVCGNAIGEMMQCHHSGIRL